MNLLITGGAGFIGSNFLRCILKKYPDYKIVVLDKLTYAGNLDNLKEFLHPDNLFLEDDYETSYPHRSLDSFEILLDKIESIHQISSNDSLLFIQGDICDSELVGKIMPGQDVVVNFAAESHVDRSILEAGSFVRTDVYGTYVLLEAVRKHKIARFVHIGTDEAYGSIEKGSYEEKDPLNPSSPYAASKAAADLLVKSYYVTYNLPVIITRSSNNFGPYQHPEKLIPLFITNAMHNESLPLYGDGMNVRDWLYVMDNCSAIDLVLHKGRIGEVYNIGADNEKANIQMTRMILELLGRPESLIKLVKDRPAHDRRYALNSSKIKRLSWKTSYKFEEAMKETVDWYINNEDWWRKIKGGKGEFQEYYHRQYGQRERI
ncbi:dTDP-glucose 4,6-dehydratase [subsurface metagenome]